MVKNKGISLFDDDSTLSIDNKGDSQNKKTTKARAQLKRNSLDNQNKQDLAPTKAQLPIFQGKPLSLKKDKSKPLALKDKVVSVKLDDDSEVIEPEVIEGEIVTSDIEALKGKTAGSGHSKRSKHLFKDAMVEDATVVEEVSPEIVHSDHKLYKDQALDAHIVDAEDSELTEVKEPTPTKHLPAVPNTLPVVSTKQSSKKRILVPDPDISDAELDIKELEVLKQIKEFNAKQLAAHEKDEEQDELYTPFDEDMDDLDSVSGMHLETQKDHERQNDLDLPDEDDEDSSKKRASRAVVRSAGNIAAFIRIANQEPLLTVEQERFLAERYREYGDIEAARKLVTSHLRLVVSVAHGYTGYGLPLPDLIQEGNVGLMKAVMHFEPESGRLAAFAVHWIRAEINDYVIRNWRMVKVATTKAQRKLFFNLRQIKKRLGWFTEHERQEVATNLGVTTQDVAEMETRLAGLDIGFDLDEEDSGSEKGVALTVSPSSYLEDESSNFAQHYENVDYSAWQVKKLKEALRSLDDRSRYIIKRRWLDETKATLQELSAELKISIERVRQIENNAMSKVKIMLVNEGVGEDMGQGNDIPKLPNKSSAKSFPLTKVETEKQSKTKAGAKATTKAKSKTSKDSAEKVSKAKGTKKAKAAERETPKMLPQAKKDPISKDHALVPIVESKLKTK